MKVLMILALLTFAAFAMADNNSDSDLAQRTAAAKAKLEAGKAATKQAATTQPAKPRMARQVTSTQPATTQPDPNITLLAGNFIDLAFMRATSNKDNDLRDKIQSWKLPVRNGLFAKEVLAGGPADLAGIKAGDLIVSVAGVATPTEAILSRLWTKVRLKAGQKYPIVFWRLDEADTEVWKRMTVVVVAESKDKFPAFAAEKDAAGGDTNGPANANARSGRFSFPTRKALIVNTCPHVQLSDFTFTNVLGGDGTEFMQDLKWKNVGQHPLVAFEIVILKYDAFNRRLIGTSWTVTGKNSADWTPLAPGQSNGDGTIGWGIEQVFTGIAYVRLARLNDGTIWRVDDAALPEQLRKAAPNIEEVGDVKPDPKPSHEK